MMLSDDWWENMDAFYHWASTQNPANLYYPNAIPTRRLLGSMVVAETLSDDEAQSIDSALCALRQDDPKGFELIELVHGEGKSLRWLEKNSKGSRYRNSRILSEAHRVIRENVLGPKKVA